MSTPPAFESRDPSAPEFWSERFENDFTPWDRGGVPEALRQFAAQSNGNYVFLIDFHGYNSGNFFKEAA